MFRIDSTGTKASLEAPAAPGATVGYFTEGDPGTGVPATVVSAEWLNTVQEELVAILTAAGVTPDKTDRDQVLTAILALMEDGDSVADFTVANNTAVAANVTGLSFNKVNYKSAVIEYDLYRKDATPTETSCIGKLVAIYKPTADTWEIQGPEEMGDDCGVTFSITAGGQIQYTSTNYTGGSYVGLMRMKIKRFKI